MFESILVGMICAAAIVIVAHTIDEVVCCARPLRAQSPRYPRSRKVASPASDTLTHFGSGEASAA